MSKITLNNIGDLTSTTTAQTALNDNFDIIEAAFDNTLSRDGEQPNAFFTDVDMNSFRLFNLPVPGSNTDPVRVAEFNEAVLGQGLGTALHVTNTTESTSVDTGSFTTDGGMGINGNLYVGGTFHAGTFTASPTELDFLGSVSGQTAVKAQAVASGTLTLPSTTDTLVAKATTDTLTNKTLTSPVINSPTGLVKADVGLSNVDNTSDSTKNSSTATLTNKTISAASNTLTGTASSLTAGNVTTNANLTGPITSAGNATSVASQTGTGSKFVMDTSPTLVTPNVGVATATSVNKVVITAPVTSATLTLANGTVITGPAATDTLVGRGSTDTLTNKTLTSPVINTPTGIVKGDVGLGNVDNTSDATKNSATATLTNKTLTSPVVNTPTGIVKGDVGLGNVDNTSDANKPVSTATATAIGLKINFAPFGGRLTLQTATPVMSTTQSAKTTIYYTPYLGDQILIYDGSAFTPTTFTEISVATTDTTKNPAAIGASKVNDWFVWNDSGTLRLTHGPDWTSDTARSAGTALVTVKGVLLNNASITNGPAASRGTYVGTTRSNGSSQLDWIYGAAAVNGTAGFLGVWNMYNRVHIASTTQDTTASWSVAANTIQSLNSSTSNRCSFVSGLAEDTFRVDAIGMTKAGTGDFSGIGVGYDSTTTLSGSNYLAGATTFSAGASGVYSKADIGFHFFQALDINNGANASTNYGNGTLTGYLQGGLVFTGRM